MRLSRHAQKQVKWRKITEKEIEETIINPDRLKDSIKERKNAFKLIGNRLLKITYKIENDDIIIVTAIVKGER
jgi:hypothetical protein